MDSTTSFSQLYIKQKQTLNSRVATRSLSYPSNGCLHTPTDTHKLLHTTTASGTCAVQSISLSITANSVARGQAGWHWGIWSCSQVAAHSLAFGLRYREAKRKKKKKENREERAAGIEINGHLASPGRLILLQHLAEVGQAPATSRTPHHCPKALEQDKKKNRLNPLQFYSPLCYLYRHVLICSTISPLFCASVSKK